jgi:hypothetical protein
MNRWVAAGCFLLVACAWAGPASARRAPTLSDLLLVAQPANDSEEPTPPGEPKAKAGEPRAQAGEPAKPGEPARGPGEPGARPGEPTPKVTAKPKRDVSYGVGLQVRGIFVPSWFLKLFLENSTALNSASIGAEFIRRKGNFDLIASMNFGFYSPPDGNYLGRGKAPAVDTDYVQFRNLNVLAFGVTFIWHHDFLKWLSLVYGAGLGFGVVLGDIYRISNGTGGCITNSSDTSQCYPVGMDLTNRETWLANRQCSPEADGPGSPCQFREDGKWPVIPIVHLLIGLNFKVTDQISIRADMGWHDCFYGGATGHYLF